MSKYLKMMYQARINNKFTDCTFVFRENGEKKTVVAHKAFLASVSQVFEAMFYGSLKEENVILIEDISLKTFEQLLDFLHGEELVLANADEFCHFYYAAEKYDIADAVEFARGFMLKNMTSENVQTFYGTAQLFKDQKLLESCKSQFEVTVYNATKALNFFRDLEPLELNDNIIYKATKTIDDSDLKNSIEKLKSEILKMENYADVVNECLALVRTLVIEVKDIFKIIISEKTAKFETSLSLVPLSSTFFHYNKVCSTKRSLGGCNLMNCSCCDRGENCRMFPASSDTIRSTLGKYENKDLSTFLYEDVKTIFKEYQGRVDISRMFQ